MNLAAIKGAAQLAVKERAWPFSEKAFQTKVSPAEVLELIASHEQMVAALRDARSSVQKNRDALYEAHHHAGAIEAAGRTAVAAEDALLCRIDVALAAAEA